jgi:hypothetical protein
LLSGVAVSRLTQPVVEYVEEVKKERSDDVVTIVLPELVSVTKWWHRLLHNTSGNALRRALGGRPDVVVTSFRYFADVEDLPRPTYFAANKPGGTETAAAQPAFPRPPPPRTAVGAAAERPPRL